MNHVDVMKYRIANSNNESHMSRLLQRIHVDVPLLMLVLTLSAVGLLILYSASNQNMKTVQNQGLHIVIGFILMLVAAQISPITMRRWAPFIYTLGLILLVAVLITGHIGKGAQRWLNFGFIRVQPSEIMKVAIPLLLAWYYHKVHLPINFRTVCISIPLVAIPALLVAKQPDLSTATILTISGLAVVYMAGLSWRLIGMLSALLISCAPLTWFVLHDYQRHRVLTFLNPERDPLGKGYHIIQSKIAIGSGGIFGKGWLSGTQSHLQFLPEHTTDFIFAVCGEEFGFVGSIMIIFLYVLIVARGLYIAVYAQDTFSRLVAASISLTFFTAFFINISMVTGVIPVMGVPLPMISYGGSAMMTLMISFGILMSIQTHKKLITT